MMVIAVVQQAVEHHEFLATVRNELNFGEFSPGLKVLHGFTYGHLAADKRQVLPCQVYHTGI